MLKRTIAISVGLGMLPVAGLADLKGATVWIGRSVYTDITLYQTDSFAANAEYDLEGSLSLQIDLSGGQSRLGQNVLGRSSSGYVHLIHDVGENTSLGVFLGHDNLDGYGYETLGIEGNTTVGGGVGPHVSLDFSAQTFSDLDGYYMLTGGAFIGLFPNLDIGLETTFDDWGVLVTSASLRYANETGTIAKVSLDRMGDFRNVQTVDFVSFNVGWDIGEGTTFNGRSLLDVYPWLF